MAIKFGMKSLQRPTPRNVGMIIDAFCGLSGVVSTWMVSAWYIPKTASDITASILGLLIAMSQIIKPYFGITTTKESVPIGDVGSMDEPIKP